jgi:hypothetical protein
MSITVTSSSPTVFRPGDFDLGGDGVGFHDSDANHSGANGVNYRPNLGDYLSNAMDIEAVEGNIGTTNAGEWLNMFWSFPNMFRSFQNMF